MPETPDPMGPDERDALIEAMARRLCRLDGLDEDDPTGFTGDDSPMWTEYTGRAYEMLDEVENAGWTRTPRPARCDTCTDTGVIPWMAEGDPNGYQDRDDEGNVPCPDCTPRPAPDDDHTSDGRCKYPATCAAEGRHGSVSEEAVEAAAWAISNADSPYPKPDEFIYQWTERIARIALTAALPHLSSSQSEADIRARALREAAETLSHWLQADSVPAPVVVRQLYDLATMAERGDDR